MFILYRLVDPRTEQTRYIGYTSKKLKKRFIEHIHNSRNEKTRGYNSHRCKWLRKLSSLSIVPRISEIVQVKTIEQAKLLEIELIKHYRSFLPNLTNNTDGGDGTKGLKWSKSSKNRKSKQLKGVKRPKEWLKVKGINILTGEEMIFENKYSAAQHIGCNHTSIASVSCGNRNSVCGWVVEFIPKRRVASLQ